MKRLLLAMTVTLAMVASGGLAQAQVIPWEVCSQFPAAEIACGVVGIHYLPEGIAHYPCDANGHAPAGATDETENLNHWISLVPDGLLSQSGNTFVALFHVIAFPEDRCIRVDGHLSISGRHYLIFDGNGVTFDQHLKPATTDPYPVAGEGTWNGSGAWRVIRSSNLQWRSFKIVGNHPEEWFKLGVLTKVSPYGSCHPPAPPLPTCEWQNGWWIAGSQHVTLEGNETRDTHGDSVEISWHANGTYWDGDVVESRYITINNHKVYGTGRQGIALVSGQDVSITNSYIEGAASNAIDIEPGSSDNGFPIRRVAITHNTFGESFATIGVLGNGDCADVTDITYAYNKQIERNWTSLPSLEAKHPTGCPSIVRGPLYITNNEFLVGEYSNAQNIVGYFEGQANLNFSSNEVKHVCWPGTTCSADEAALTLWGGSGYVLNNNNLAVTGGQAWASVYKYDGIAHGSLGTNVDSCGNTTAQGANQPQACLLPLP